MNFVWFLIPLTLLLWGLALLVRIYPYRTALLLLLVPAFLSLWLMILPDLWPGVLILDVALMVAAIVDLFSLAGKSSFAVERQVGLIASLGQAHDAHLTVTNHQARSQLAWIRDGIPPELVAEPEEFSVELPARSRSTLRYTLRSHRRGAFELPSVYIRIRSRWGFWQRTLKFTCQSRINVYPDMKQLSEYAILARTNRLSLIGMRRTRKIGQDNEFERLRDYTLDDNYRHIDWRSTARRGKLTVKDFQANQSQRLMFMIDCGRMMTGEAAGVSLLDHAFNAMLMLSFVALRQGDQVGLMCFSNEIHTFVPPRGGREQNNRLLHAAYDRFPAMVESRYDEAFLHLATHVRKRTLVILITNIIDEVNAYQIQRHLKQLSGRHLPLGVLLRDHALFDSVEAVEEELDFDHFNLSAEPPAVGPGQHLRVPAGTAGLATVDDIRLYRAAAAAEILTWRHHVLADLATNGVLLLDVFPEHLTAPLVNQYLDIKARHLL